MKKDIHPKYHSDAVVSCACGHSFTTGSILPEIKTELCSACHPFYTGKQKLVDSARRVEKFQAKAEKQRTSNITHRSKTAKLAAKAAKRSERTEKTVTKIGKK